MFMNVLNTLKLKSPLWLKRLAPLLKKTPKYKGDGMILENRTTNHLDNERFKKAYSLAVNSGHKINGGGDLHIEWKCYVACWCATQALKIEGDLVECGVNTGMLSLCLSDYIDLNKHDNKLLYLFDTFNGIPIEQAQGEEELIHAVINNQLNYEDCFISAYNNFNHIKNAILIPGKVPETLTQFNDARSVSYLSIDMNITYPERAALQYFWPKLSKGACVLLDDYGFKGYEKQRASADEFALSVNVNVLALPTGQGLIIKL